MNDYDTEIVITSVLKFTSKKNGKEMTKLDLLLTNPDLCGVSDSFVGCTPVTLWYNGFNVFEKIVNNSLILKGATGHFVCSKDFKDPTRMTSRLESLKYKDNVITLLQSN